MDLDIRSLALPMSYTDFCCSKVLRFDLEKLIKHD
jgi:hypothetical protein